MALLYDNPGSGRYIYDIPESIERERERERVRKRETDREIERKAEIEKKGRNRKDGRERSSVELATNSAIQDCQI